MNIKENYIRILNGLKNSFRLLLIHFARDPAQQQ